MKAELVPITKEIMEDKEKFTKALNDNFNSLNNMAEAREIAIFRRLSDIKTALKVELSAELTSTINRVMDEQISALAKDLGWDPDLLKEE